jgi:hypothetical protein
MRGQSFEAGGERAKMWTMGKREMTSELYLQLALPKPLYFLRAFVPHGFLVPSCIIRKWCGHRTVNKSFEIT